MKLAATVVATFSLMSCATGSYELPVALISGSDESLDRFESAARACGVDVRSILLSHGRWVSVGIGRASDPRTICAMQWITDHPNEDLYFVGDEQVD